MDSSEQYIKMSFKAWGYSQGIEIPTIPFISRKDGKQFLLTGEGHWYFDARDGSIPLKTQDQLQYMVLLHWEHSRNLSLVDNKSDYVLNEFLNFYGKGHKNKGKDTWGVYDYDYVSMKKELRGKYNSMEQLWLAFVMKEKYGKVWNRDEWK